MRSGEYISQIGKGRLMRNMIICLEHRGTGGQRGDEIPTGITFPAWKGTRLERLFSDVLRGITGRDDPVYGYGDMESSSMVEVDNKQYRVKKGLRY